MAKQELGEFRFRGSDRVGYNDAEEDEVFLKDCFIDTGLVEILGDCQRPERIVLGRTGSGKSALLLQLASRCDRVITIKPENLALSHISNSNILQFFEAIGVKLDIFHKLLWRHTLCVELLQLRFGRGADRVTWVDWLRKKVDKRFSRAVDYLSNWSESFWENTETRVRQITRKMENELAGSVKAELDGSGITAAASTKLTEEDKSEMRIRGQEIVNKVHIRELEELLLLVNHVLSDAMKPVHVIIDHLDEPWVAETVRLPLIMALIETVKDFRKVANVKVIVALREDLLRSVLDEAKPRGFQEEKLETIAVRVVWTREQLVDLVERRLNRLVRHRYQPKKPLRCGDVIGRVHFHTGSATGIDYMLERTLLRPRDAISFLNLCIEQAGDKPRLSAKTIVHAEGAYSSSRLSSLEDEWKGYQPSLVWFLRRFFGRRRSLKLGSVSDNELADVFVAFAVEPTWAHDRSPLAMEVRQAAEGSLDSRGVFYKLICFLYRTSAIGIQLADGTQTHWSHQVPRTIAATELCAESRTPVHPMFWEALSIARQTRQ